MMQPSAIIADDEAPIKEHLQRMLTRLWPDLHIAGTAVNGSGALALIRECEPDVAFLDIKMPLLSGLEVAARMDAQCRVVFTTAYDDYAVQAFENAALDYLLKPIEERRLELTIQRLKQSLAASEPPDPQWLAAFREIANGARPGAGSLRWLRASTREGTVLIPADEVIYFKADRKYTTVVTGAGEHLIRKTIKELEAELDPNVFWRIHRGIIVNAGFISIVRRGLNGSRTVCLKGRRETLTASRAYRHLFEHM